MQEIFEKLRTQENDRLQAWVEYCQAQERLRERTAQLRALRLARDTEKTTIVVADPAA